MSEMVNQALCLIRKAAELEELRQELSYEAIGGHGQNKPGGEFAHVQHTKTEQGLTITSEDLLRFSKHADYAMRRIARSMNDLIKEMEEKLKIEVIE
jgi:hypothetical protein